MMINSPHHHAVQTTGYIWDGDIQEFNHFIPKIWWYGLLVTVVFALGFWLLYPAWPLGNSYTKGYFNHISYQLQGTTIHSHWNSRALLFRNLQKKENNKDRQEYLLRLTALPLPEIAADPKLLNFAYSLAQSIFSDNCVPCHGGNADIFTRLATDNQSWHGSLAQIEQAIMSGHSPDGTNWKQRLSIPQIKALSIYVQQLPTRYYR